MRNLLALLLFLPGLCLAQAPSYVPADGLVAWWALDGDGSDQSAQGNDGTVIGATPGTVTSPPILSSTEPLEIPAMASLSAV